MLEQILTVNIFAFMLIFARVGTTLFIMPGFGGQQVNMRARLSIALAISFLVTPILSSKIPPMPSHPIVLFSMMAAEILAGAVIGTVPLILMAAFHTAGTVIAFISSMANSLIFDPIAQQQSAVVAGFLTSAATLLLFAMDLHHLFIRAIIDSYEMFAPGIPLNIGDTLYMLARHTGDSFRLGIQMAAPFLLLSFAYNIGLGILSRLAPAIPSFFVIMPVQISLALIVLAIVVPSLMLVGLTNVEQGMMKFLRP
ncbi:MAG: flagellar biosynthetic protein FliR [Rhodospirillales bacterium]|nr:flagellar biosynthetic protein FliR [Rhodospirillales bacterium]